MPAHRKALSLAKIKTMRLLLIIMLGILFAACKKEATPYNFTGAVKDEQGNIVANASVELLAYYNSANAISPGGLNTLAKTVTNNSGQFKVGFNRGEHIKYYQINVFADGYFPFYIEYLDSSNFLNNTFTYNPNIYKLATIKISFKNTSPVSNADEFHVYQENELFGAGFDTFLERQFTGGTFNELDHKYLGNLIDGYEITKTKGDTYTFINWYSKKNGVIVNQRDSIFIAGSRQGNYTISY